MKIRIYLDNGEDEVRTVTRSEYEALKAAGADMDVLSQDTEKKDTAKVSDAQTVSSSSHTGDRSADSLLNTVLPAEAGDKSTYIVPKKVAPGTTVMDEAGKIDKGPAAFNRFGAGAEYAKVVGLMKDEGLATLRKLYRGNWDDFQDAVEDGKPLPKNASEEQVQLYAAVKGLLELDPTDPLGYGIDDYLTQYAGNKFVDLIRSNTELKNYTTTGDQSYLGRVQKAAFPNLTLRQQEGEGIGSQLIGAGHDVLTVPSRIASATMEGMLPTGGNLTWEQRVGRPVEYSTPAENALDFTGSSLFPGKIIDVAGGAAAKAVSKLPVVQRSEGALANAARQVARVESPRDAVMGINAPIYQPAWTYGVRGAGTGAAYAAEPSLVLATGPERMSPDGMSQAAWTMGASALLGGLGGLASGGLSPKIMPRDEGLLSEWGREVLGGPNSVERVKNAASRELPSQRTTAEAGQQQLADISEALAGLSSSRLASAKNLVGKYNEFTPNVGSGFDLWASSAAGVRKSLQDDAKDIIGKYVGVDMGSHLGPNSAMDMVVDLKARVANGEFSGERLNLVNRIIDEVMTRLDNSAATSQGFRSDLQWRMSGQDISKKAKQHLNWKGPGISKAMTDLGGAGDLAGMSSRYANMTLSDLAQMGESRLRPLTGDFSRYLKEQQSLEALGPELGMSTVQLDYLTPAAIRAARERKTSVDGTIWNALAKRAMESSPGLTLASLLGGLGASSVKRGIQVGMPQLAYPDYMRSDNTSRSYTPPMLSRIPEVSF